MVSPKNRLKIAFLTSGDARSRHLWSGTPYYMAKALEKHGADVSYLGPVHPLRKIVGKVGNRVSQLLLKKTFDYTHSLFMARAYARMFDHRLAGRTFDLIFAPAASTEIALLDTELPIVSTSDTTFNLIHNYYPGFTGFLNVSTREGNIIEEASLRKASLVLYPTEWAARSAVADYGADPNKVQVVPYGANLDRKSVV